MYFSPLMAQATHRPQETPCSIRLQDSTSQIGALSTPSPCCFPGENKSSPPSQQLLPLPQTPPKHPCSAKFYASPAVNAAPPL